MLNLDKIETDRDMPSVHSDLDLELQTPDGNVVVLNAQQSKPYHWHISSSNKAQPGWTCTEFGDCKSIKMYKV